MGAELPAPALDGDLALVAGARVLVALSGGPDSTALLLWLVEGGVDVAAAHYDHAIRAGSEHDSAWVAGLCARLGVGLVTERRQEPLAKGSAQAPLEARAIGSSPARWRPPSGSWWRSVTPPTTSRRAPCSISFAAAALPG